jgi:hypothetical protein
VQEVLRLFRGERWVDIQAERRQRQQLVAALCVIGFIVLLGASLTRDG